MNKAEQVQNPESQKKDRKLKEKKLSGKKTLLHIGKFSKKARKSIPNFRVGKLLKENYWKKKVMWLSRKVKNIWWLIIKKRSINLDKKNGYSRFIRL